ncbi:hypothetical protein CFC21_021807 [Triticum aestivum]|uniref:Uncharacterized protein n=2 Tax=Triticum aestivum TaxID=4565 RepID=A0A9R1EAN6_WHEAT|nr:hypothetical protein CFC21_021807 [Triticum aestivum]
MPDALLSGYNLSHLQRNRLPVSPPPSLLLFWNGYKKGGGASASSPSPLVPHAPHWEKGQTTLEGSARRTALEKQGTCMHASALDLLLPPRVGSELLALHCTARVLLLHHGRSSLRSPAPPSACHARPRARTVPRRVPSGPTVDPRDFGPQRNQILESTSWAASPFGSDFGSGFLKSDSAGFALWFRFCCAAAESVDKS